MCCLLWNYTCCFSAERKRFYKSASVYKGEGGNIRCTLPPPPSHAYTISFPSFCMFTVCMHLQESWSDTGNPTHSLFPLPLSPPSSPPISPFPPFPTFLSSFSSLPTSPPSFPEGYGVMLDHRHLHTPLRRKFVIPSEPLALAVAQEWNAQGTFVQPQLMHLVSESVLFPDCCRTRLAL